MNLQHQVRRHCFGAANTNWSNVAVVNVARQCFTNSWCVQFANAFFQSGQACRFTSGNSLKMPIKIATMIDANLSSQPLSQGSVVGELSKQIGAELMLATVQFIVGDAGSHVLPFALHGASQIQCLFHVSSSCCKANAKQSSVGVVYWESIVWDNAWQLTNLLNRG